MNARGGDNERAECAPFFPSPFPSRYVNAILSSYQIEPSQGTRNRESRGANICLGRSNIGTRGRRDRGREPVHLHGRENAKFSISKKNCFRFSGAAKEGGSWRKDVGTMVNAE